MEKILAYLKSLEKSDLANFAERCDTTIGYLRKAVYSGQQLSATLCINLERESKGLIRCEDIRPDVDWAFIRNTQKEND